MLRQLRDANVPLKQTAINVNRAVSAQSKVQALVAADPELKSLAQKAFVSYMRSVFLQPNKEVCVWVCVPGALAVFACQVHGLLLAPAFAALQLRSFASPGVRLRGVARKSVCRGVHQRPPPCPARARSLCCRQSLGLASAPRVKYAEGAKTQEEARVLRNRNYKLEKLKQRCACARITSCWRLTARAALQHPGGEAEAPRAARGRAGSAQSARGRGRHGRRSGAGQRVGGLGVGVGVGGQCRGSWVDCEACQDGEEEQAHDRAHAAQHGDLGEARHAGRAGPR